jgi:exonuclease SbcC
MRILKLNFQNLNSLTGNWQIDFTHPEYLNSGIFAITGPTGSGKTTMLDAVCLALYGTTPRLSRINKNTNEIMSRHTGECFAEVEFQTLSGVYRCHWAQHRARKKPEGDLQNPKHEIVDVKTGKVLEHQIKKVADKVESITGLKFAQFTKSILLAQGGFAAFLQAGPTERAPILEQITGTNIYSEISKSVHHRKSDEALKLELMEHELGGIKLLTDEEIGIHNSQIKALELSVNELKKSETSLGTEIRCFEQKQNFLKQIDTLKLQSSDLEKKRTAHQDDFSLWSMAQKTKLLEPDYTKLSTQRAQLKTYQDELNQLQEILPKQTAELKNKKEIFQQTEIKLKNQQQSHDTTRTLVTKVEKLDINISNEKKQLVEYQAAFEKLQNELIMVQREKSTLDQQFTQVTHELLECETYLKDYSNDSVLIENHALIETISKQLLEKHDFLTNKQALLGKHQSTFEKIKCEYKSLLDETNSQNKLCDEAENELKRLEQQIAKLLKGIEYSEYQNKHNDLSQNLILLNQINEKYTTIESNEKKLAEINIQIKKNQNEHDHLSPQKDLLEEQLKLHEKRLQDKFSMVELEKSILNLQDERKKLTEGQPCPLCGSKNHPYQIETPEISPEKSISELEQLQKDMSSTNSKLNELGKKIASHEQALAGNLKLQNSIEDEISQINASISELKIKLNWNEQKITKDSILEKTQETQKKIDSIKSLFAKYQQLDSTKNTQRQRLEELKNISTQNKDKLNTLDTNRLSLEQNIESCQQEIENLNSEIITLKTQVLDKVSSMGFNESHLSNMKQLVLDLKDRKSLYESKINLQNIHKTKLSELNEKLKGNSKEQDSFKSSIDENNEKIKSHQLKISELEKERTIFFGDKSTQDELQNSKQMLTQFEQQLEENRKSYLSLEQQIAVLNEKLDSTKSNITECGKTLKNLESSFYQQLKAHNFDNEIQFSSNLLSQEKYLSLQTLIQAMEKETNEIETKLNHLKKQVDEIKCPDFSETSYEDSLNKLKNLSEEISETQKQIGIEQQKLNENEKNASQFADKKTQIDSQKKELSRWDRLHELIGSADGKKFRNFAQGLTFEIVIEHANVQLQKMTDRYHLTRDTSHPLALATFDNWQGGILRSVKNLSGGESFIVSLALALGLSKMASKNVRVDSLFLDEGFGTLDEETLEVALDALSSLHQEGKLIGVISHVPALKERITTQLVLTPETGGRSSIEGPGVSKI